MILMVTLWLQKVIKSKKIVGISVKPQQHIATKENDSRSMFAEYMSQHGASSTAEISAFSGLSPQRTRAILAKMVEDGIVIAEGANKTRKYRLQ